MTTLNYAHKSTYWVTLPLILFSLLLISSISMPNLSQSTSPSLEAQILSGTGIVTGDSFGFDVAIDGNTAVVGAKGADHNGIQDVGAVFVYGFVNGAWQEQQKLVASDGEPGDEFGHAVDIDGTQIVVGAPSADIDFNNNDNAGAVYVFQKNLDGTWSEQAIVTEPVRDSGNQFGYSVATDGIWMVAGSYLDCRFIMYICRPEVGSAYIFSEGDGSWPLYSFGGGHLQAPDPSDSQFGFSVEVDNNTVFVGAPKRDSDGGADSGAIYIYSRDLYQRFSHRQTLEANTPGSNDRFGHSVAADFPHIVVGAPLDDTNYGSDSGSAIGFSYNSSQGVWQQSGGLIPSSAYIGTGYKAGTDVAVNNGIAVVGADGANNNAGVAYVFRYIDFCGIFGGCWFIDMQVLTSSTVSASDGFGSSVAINGSRIMVGSPFDDPSCCGDDAGAAFVYYKCATISSAECDALVALFQSTGGPNWLNNTDWLENPDPCQWYGVRCENEHVTNLILSQNNLIGPLPSKVGDLVWLTRLDLSNNDLSGPIPPEIGLVTSLDYLSLYGNQLSGTIPPEIGNLVNLDKLLLGVNRLDGPIPPELGNIDNKQDGSEPKLTNLSLGYNALIGDIPLSIANFTDLSFINLSNNRLTASNQSVLNFLLNFNATDYGEQTLPPGSAPSIDLSRVQADRIGKAWAARINWDLIDYTDDPGYYRVLVSDDPANFDLLLADPALDPLPTGVTEACISVDKTVNECEVPDLVVGTTYYFVVQTFTAAHVGTGGEQQNDLYSTLSDVLEFTMPPEDGLFIGSPGDVINTGLGNPVFIWTNVSGAIQFDFYLGRVAGDAWSTIVYETGLAGTTICTAGDLCYFDPIDMSAGFGLTDGQYTVFVNAYDAGGNSVAGGTLAGGWVQHDFTVNLPNADLPVIAVNPGEGRIAVQWPDDPNSLWVNIWAGPHPSGNYFKWLSRDSLGLGSETQEEFACDGTTCTAYPVWDVPTATNLTVWMQAWGPGGFSEGGTAEPNAQSWNQMSVRVDGAGVETPATTFNLPADTPAAPTNIGVADATVADPVITWLGSAGTTWYNVVVYDPASNAIPVNEWYTHQDVACSGALVDPPDYDCELSGLGLDTLLSPNTTYDIWMRSWGPGGFGKDATGLAPNWNKGTFTYTPA